MGRLQRPEEGRSSDGALDVSVRTEELWRRRCRGCGWEAPVHLEWCRRCPAVLGDPFPREIGVFATNRSSGTVPSLIRPIAVLALELSGPLARVETLVQEAKAILRRLIEALPPTAVFRGLANGVLAVLFPAGSLDEGVAAAAWSADEIARNAPKMVDRPGLERRAALASGLVDGVAPWQAAVVRHAAGLARSAQRGQTLASYAVAGMLSHEWQFGPIGILARRQEDVAYDAAALLLGRRRPAPTPSAFVADHGAALVGRTHELAVLDHELAKITAGGGGWLGLVAPAGAGKSKLLRHWLDRLSTPVPPVPRVLGATASAFGQVPRGLVDQLLAALGCPLPPDAPHERTLSALVGALEQAARERPLVVVIDDLHWSDAPSRLLLRSLDPWLPPRCLVVVALRTSFLPSVSWLEERARMLRLTSLTDAERASLLDRLLPGDAAAPLRAKVLAACEEPSPLYLQQAAAYLGETGGDTHLPGSLHELVLHRLEIVRSRINRSGYERLIPDELAKVERTVGEWLDRLETDDYDDRMAIASYLDLLEQIDLSLVVAGSIAGVA
ncbi:MAG: AAA family ATPase [Acidimicrobiales bacterium]